MKRSRLLSLVTAALLALAPGLLAQTFESGDGAGSQGPGPINDYSELVYDGGMAWGQVMEQAAPGAVSHTLSMLSGMFPEIDFPSLAGNGYRTLTRACSPGTGCAPSYDPEDYINTEGRGLEAYLDDGTRVVVQMHSTAGGNGNSASLGSCQACAFDNHGGFLVTVQSPTAGRASGRYYSHYTGGAMDREEVETSLTYDPSEGLVIDGPATVSEDSENSWRADTSGIELPDEAENVAFAYAWGGAVSGSGETVSETFADPGSAFLQLTVTVTLDLPVPENTCEDGEDGVPVCSTAIVLEAQPAMEFHANLDVTITDGTPPDLTVRLPEGRVVVGENPVDAPPPKRASVATVGNFEGETASPQDYDEVEVAAYQMKEADPLTVELLAADNSGGEVQTSWRLELSGGVTGSIDGSGGTIEELEANYPIGAVTYELIAEARDQSGNETVVKIPIDVLDVELGEVDISFSVPGIEDFGDGSGGGGSSDDDGGIDEDTFYPFEVASPILKNDEDQPVPPEIPWEEAGFEDATWSDPPELEEVTLDGEPVIGLAALLGDILQVRGVTMDAAEGKAVIDMRLLWPRRQVLGIELKRRFRYSQRIGGAGEIDRIERFVRARQEFVLEPDDITPPRLELRLVPADNAYPRAGVATLVADEEPEHSEPAPVKQAVVRIEAAPGLDPRFREEVSGTEGPYPMAAQGGAHLWLAHVSRDAGPAPDAGPGAAHVPQDVFVLEDVGLAVAEGEQVLVEDNHEGTVTTEIRLVADELTLAGLAASGPPTPNYLFEQEPGLDIDVAAGVREDAPGYRLEVVARDEAGNQSSLVVPLVVVDVTPPGMQLELRSQDAQDFHLDVMEDPIDVPPGEKGLSMALRGPYLGPTPEESPGEVPLLTTLGWDGHPELTWVYGLYPGSAEGDPSVTDPSFGAEVPDALTGIYAPANVRIRVRVQATDNHPSALASEFLDRRGMSWWLEDEDGLKVAGENPEYLLVRASTWPPPEDVITAAHTLVLRGQDASDNTLELRIPMYFVGKDFAVQKLSYEGGRR